jgi:hypothetical protein
MEKICPSSAIKRFSSRIDMTHDGSDCDLYVFGHILHIHELNILTFAVLNP